MERNLVIKLNGRRKIEGFLIGYDYLMNIVLDNAVEHLRDEKRHLGKCMIRGNSIILWECKDKMWHSFLIIIYKQMYNGIIIKISWPIIFSSWRIFRLCGKLWLIYNKKFFGSLEI